MPAYEKFDIVDVAKKCGVTFKPFQRDGVEMEALCPFCGDNKFHLGLNRDKERFHCFRCNEKGNSVSLYAKIYGLSNKDAYDALKGNDFSKMPIKPYVLEKQQTPIRPLADRHAVYYDFLQMLHLQESHKDNLLSRGLEFHHICQFMYRSLPLDNTFRRRLLNDLSEKHNLRGIPGFFQDDYGDWQMYLKQCGGILIPVCDHSGYIQGLQIRLDTADERKFRWFSSSYYAGGTGVRPWVHVVGDIYSKTACLTEGPLKADVASVLCGGALFLAVPGVNSIGCLAEVLRRLEIHELYEAFDMDKKTNIHVKRALTALQAELKSINVKYSSCSWNPAYKGVDEYYHFKCKQASIAA